MTYISAPSAIIFINSDLTDQIKSVVQRQLIIDDTITGTEFDNRVVADPNYVSNVHANGLRVLVIRPFTELINRDKADLVLYFFQGLISVEASGFGPPGKTLPLNQVYFTGLIN